MYKKHPQKKSNEYIKHDATIEWVPNLPDEPTDDKPKLKRASANFLRKGARINIKISYNDLARLKRIAEAEGVPYDTMVSNVLHKFVTNYEEIA